MVLHVRNHEREWRVFSLVISLNIKNWGPHAKDLRLFSLLTYVSIFLLAFACVLPVQPKALIELLKVHERIAARPRDGSLDLWLHKHGLWISFDEREKLNGMVWWLSLDKFSRLVSATMDGLKCPR